MVSHADRFGLMCWDFCIFAPKICGAISVKGNVNAVLYVIKSHKKKFTISNIFPDIMSSIVY